MDWREGDLRSCKRFSAQDTVCNYAGFLYRAIGTMLEEYNVLDCDCNNRHWYDPLDVLSRFPMGRKFTFCKIVRLRGFIHSSTVKDFLRLLVWGKYPLM